MTCRSIDRIFFVGTKNIRSMVEEVMKLSMELQKCLFYILSCVALTAAKSTSSNLFNANGEHRIVGVKFLSEF